MVNRVSREKIIRVLLYKQQLYQSPTLSGKDGIEKVLNQLGLIQIDTINVLTKSHNLVFLSRLESYKESDLIKLYNEKKVYESYVHAMSLLPMDQAKLINHRLKEYKDALFSTLSSEETDLILSVYQKILSNHPISTKEVSANFYHPTGVLATWEMSPVRWALDQLWRCGLIHVMRDLNFNKVYIPAVDHSSVEETAFDINSSYCLKALNALGAGTVKDIADYYRIKIDDAREGIKTLESDKKVRRIEVEHLSEPYYIAVNDEWLLSEDALSDEPLHSCLLSPFDNLIWHRIRLMNLFEVDYRLESYLPKHQRKYGYFALPILIKGRIVGTVDMKFDRKTKRLMMNALFFYNTFDAVYYKTELIHLFQRYQMLLNADSMSISDALHEDLHKNHSLLSLVKSLN